MPHKSAELLVEERVAQLEEISERRNALLCQMYQMIRRRHNLGSVLTLNYEDEDDLHAFLQRFKMSGESLGAGSITSLSESELSAPPPLEGFVSSNPLLSKALAPRRATRSSHRVAERVPSLPTPGPSHIEPVAVGSPEGSVALPPQTGQPDDERDELDLFRKSPSAVLDRNPPPAAGIATEAHGREVSEVGNMVPTGSLGEGDDQDMDTSSMLRSKATTPIENVERCTSPKRVQQEQNEIMDVDIPNATSSFSEITPKRLSGTPEEGLVHVFDRIADDGLQSHEQAREAEFKDEQEAMVVENEISSERRSPQYASSFDAFSQLHTSHISSLFVPITAASERRPVIPVNTSSHEIREPEYKFGDISPLVPTSSAPAPQPQPRYQFEPNYTLPPFKSAYPDFRKAKTTKRKRDKEREKSDHKKEDWAPLGLSRWAATVNANPVWRKVSRASKCLSSRDWAIAMSELRLIRAIDRVEILKREGRWSFRQPKKQRGVGGLGKTHWDYLLDEMKWMRIDFREERKWKLALAYNLSTAVLDWHAAGTRDVRLVKGICVQWKRPSSPVHVEMDEDPYSLAHMEIGESQDSLPQQNTSLLGVDYGSDEEDDDTENLETDPQDVVNDLEPSTLIENALADASQSTDTQGEHTQDILPKTEDIDDASVLINRDRGIHLDMEQGDGTAMDIEEAKPMDIEEAKPMDIEEAKTMPIPSGLKTTSSDPVLASKPTPSSSNGDTENSVIPLKSSSKINLFAPFREMIAYLDDDKLFLDVDDFNVPESLVSSSNLPEETPLPPSDFTEIFPDLQVLTLVDVSPVVPSILPDGKRRSEKKSDRDDPNKRSEDTTYTKLFPTGDFMTSKLTLLGPLRPSKNWKNGEWLLSDESAVMADNDNSSKVPDDSTSELFDSRSNNAPSVMLALQMQVAFLKDRDNRKRTADHLWTATDDALLKTYIDKYPNNWALIAECFNAVRLTISTDRRTPRDCLERWRDKWGPEARRPVESSTMAEDNVPSTSNQMTTRGVKRLASASVSGPSPVGIAAGSEPRKRRRHHLVQETIRKAAKKRADALQKVQASQRKAPAIHETHAQYSKLPKRTPAELSRMKAEKEARDQQEIQLARRRQEELARQMREHGHRMNPNIAATQPQQPQQAQQQQAQQPSQAQQQPGNAVPRPPGQAISPAQGIPQLRQVNISQQQRISGTPAIPSGNNRMSPQQAQLLQVQARVTQQQQIQHAQVHAQALAQAQTQVQNAVAVNGNIPSNTAHQSPSYTSRDATSSPAHLSPPHNVSVPSTVNSPRPPSAQAHHLLQASQVPGNAGTRGGYYMPNLPGLNTEQLHAALRLQHQQHQMQQQGPNGFLPQ
ncbi:Chromatin modification-related protein EAF1 [Hypsizygus marmoreus]|uniref:Vacuolar import and degradation protein 21 n=1 Tax=Hypsizygus marmoreus TaxID=39966 RepID=A0A369JK19_HYPMA|nr:Chromatin modification-related protein EAF1 [Hypsizygus marmoreus]